MDEQELFLETHYLGGGKRHRARMLIGTLTKVRKVLERVAPDRADDIMDAFYEEAEDMDASAFLDPSVLAYAQLRFPGQEVCVRHTGNGVEVLVGPRPERYAVLGLEAGACTFEPRGH